MSHCADFNPELMYRVRQIFETDLNIEDTTIENTDLVKDTESPIEQADYSLFAYIPHCDMNDDKRKKLAEAYSVGTKLYVITEDQRDLAIIAEAINDVIIEKGLIADGLNLKINFEGQNKEKKTFAATTFQVFNCVAYSVSPLDMGEASFEIKDGKNISEKQLGVMKQIDKVCNFNLEQYKIEHADSSKNIIVKAGAGTGKTFTMISRISYICHIQNCSMKEMAKRIVMITFTDDAANQMEDKIRQHFNNYYLLTGDGDCLAFINQIEGMQISTIFKLCIEKKENVERLIKMQTGRPQYMFVDEFQDTDDVQIEAISQIAKLLQYKLFVVGDVKQCIYRFRGAKENAFKQLGADNNPEWQIHSLYKNYRTDAKLLDVFHSTFSDLGRRTEGGEPLLIYKGNGTEYNTDRLIGTRDYNMDIKQSEFYKKITISTEEERIPVVFEEVERIREKIKSLEEQGEVFSEKDKEIAILVRENWQAESIKQAGKRMGFEVLTNTGGEFGFILAKQKKIQSRVNAMLAHMNQSKSLS